VGNVNLVPLKRVSNPKGDILHAMRATDVGFNGFGEAYFTNIICGETKGWKKHFEMTLNLIVPVGIVRFHLHDEIVGNTECIELGKDNYQRLTVSPGIWVAFTGIQAGTSLVLNIANIPHDPTESINLPLESFTL
jgi:dTDP-4-dehydrorhamnose 3,5-epimerase